MGYAFGTILGALQIPLLLASVLLNSIIIHRNRENRHWPDHQTVYYPTWLAILGIVFACLTLPSALWLVGRSSIWTSRSTSKWWIIAAVLQAFSWAIWGYWNGRTAQCVGNALDASKSRWSSSSGWYSISGKESTHMLQLFNMKMVTAVFIIGLVTAILLFTSWIHALIRALRLRRREPTPVFAETMIESV